MNYFKKWCYQKLVNHKLHSLSNNFDRNKNQNYKTDFWRRKLILKIKFWWLVLIHDEVNASSVTKITNWLKFLDKNLHLAGCATVYGKSEVMLLKMRTYVTVFLDSKTLQPNWHCYPDYCRNNILRLGCQHRADPRNYVHCRQTFLPVNPLAVL